MLIFCVAAADGVTRVRAQMGTYATVVVDAAHAACSEDAFNALNAVEKSLSSYDPSAEIYRLNKQRRSAISRNTYEALRRAKHYYKQTNGYFDITIGSVTKAAYRFGTPHVSVPSSQSLANATIDIDGLEFNATTAILSEGITLDLGGFGKGFGVDKAVEALRACGVTQGRVGLSGDIRCLGLCRLGIEDPFGGEPLLTFMTRHSGTGISTSGNYRRYVKTKAHNHLIDPKTKRPERTFASVTLLGTASSSDLDAWTTAAAVMPYEAALAFLHDRPVAFVLVCIDGTIVVSDNVAFYAQRVERRDAVH